MTSQNFCYWLQGYFELTSEKKLTPDQVQVIKNHLAMVFRHEIDPQTPDPTGTLQQAHNGPFPPSGFVPFIPPDCGPVVPVDPPLYRC